MEWTWASPEQLSSEDKHALAIGPFGSNLKVSDYRDSGVPLIFVRNIRSGVFSSESTRFVSYKKAEELNAHQVIGGDLLITKMGDPPGDAYLYPENAPTAIITADCIRLQLSLLLEKSKAFFVHCINSKLGRDQILQITKGVAQQKVSLSRFSSIAFPLPPFAEQVEIIRQVDHRLAAADKLAVVLEQQMTQARTTRQSLLREAFAGRLVPQNPDDEPASVLLERIRSEKAQREAERKQDRRELRPAKNKRGDLMKEQLPSSESLRATWKRIGQKADARLLFNEAGFGLEHVVQFYEVLRATPEVRAAFQEAAQRHRPPQRPVTATPTTINASEPKGCFRLVELWLEDFRNLKDYTVRFDPTHGLDVIQGEGGRCKNFGQIAGTEKILLCRDSSCEIRAACVLLQRRPENQ